MGGNKKFLINTSWMMIERIYSMILSLVVSSISARYSGPSNYGIINYGATIISFFTIITRLGLDSVAINEIVKNPEKEGKYLGTILVARLITAILSFGIIIGIVVVLEPENKLLHTVTALQAFAVVLQSYEVFIYWFKAKLKMKLVSIATMIALTAVAAWRVSLLAMSAGVEWFALSNSINYAVMFFIVGGIFIKSSQIHLQFAVDEAKYLIGKSYHFIISGLAVTFYSQIDKVMIGKLLGENDLGLYSAAVTIACLWEFIPQALITSAQPLIVAEKMNNYNGYIRKFQQLLLSVTCVFIAAGIAVSIFGKLAIWILYGNEFLPATSSLAILMWSTGMAIIGSARNIWLVEEGISRYTKHFTLLGAVVNCILNYIGITKWGINGAAMATLVSQIFVCFIAPMLFKETRAFNRLFFTSYHEINSMLKYIKR